jgi:hypothetical protein
MAEPEKEPSGLTVGASAGGVGKAWAKATGDIAIPALPLVGLGLALWLKADLGGLGTLAVVCALFAGAGYGHLLAGKQIASLIDQNQKLSDEVVRVATRNRQHTTAVLKEPLSSNQPSSKKSKP